jgi:hypothetical protein
MSGKFMIPFLAATFLVAPAMLPSSYASTKSPWFSGSAEARIGGPRGGGGGGGTFGHRMGGGGGGQSTTGNGNGQHQLPSNRYSHDNNGTASNPHQQARTK